MKYGVKGVTVQVYKVSAEVAEEKHGWAKPEAECIFI